MYGYRVPICGHVSHAYVVDNGRLVITKNKAMMVRSFPQRAFRRQLPEQQRRCCLVNKLRLWYLSCFWFAFIACWVALRLAALKERRPTIGGSQRLLVFAPVLPHEQPPEQQQVPMEIQSKTCAIVLYGLPRSFIRLVLPSLKRHVIEVNTPRYHCDYYAHWYSDRQELPSRSGHGGLLDGFSKVSLALKAAIKESHYRHSCSNQSNCRSILQPPKILFATDTNATFWDKYNDLMTRIWTTKGRRAFRKHHAVDPRLLYWPVKDKSYTAQTMVNLVKVWHSIQLAFQLTEGRTNYDRVVMLRSDVVYLCPIDIWKIPTSNNRLVAANVSSFQSYDYDVRNEYAVAPGGFSMFPVNDRLIYGPASAVKVLVQ